LKVTDRYRNGGPRHLYRLTVRPLATDFQLTTADSIGVNSDKPTDVEVAINRTTGGEGKVETITVEAIDLPPGVKCEPVVSEAEGESAKKVTLSFSTDGTAFSGPIRIRGTAEKPEVTRLATTAPKFGGSTNVIWLTAIGK